tara:strand:+ start:54 stop:347 length:294 start_codon:yes stop_codon:yes gene_type:complete
MIKATRKYKANGEGCTFMNIKITIDKSNLINTIIFLLDSSHTVNKTSVEKRLKSELYTTGSEFDSYIEERLGLDDDVFDALKVKATTKAKELFPDFF